MDAWITRVWQEIVERPGGPFAMRFYLQPTMAAFFAIRDGLKDARAGRHPYLWDFRSHPERRRELLRDGWKSVGKIFIIACVLDIVYQLAVLRGFRPVQTLLIATMLAVFPYAVLRGPANRIFSRWRNRNSRGDQQEPDRRAS